jgi:hypothetical protein
MHRGQRNMQRIFWLGRRDGPGIDQLLRKCLLDAFLMKKQLQALVR